MVMLSPEEEVKSIIVSHKGGEISFHVAHKLLVEDHNFTEDAALNMLFPPFTDENTWAIDVNNNLEGLLHD